MEYRVDRQSLLDYPGGMERFPEKESSSYRLWRYGNDSFGG